MITAFVTAEAFGIDLTAAIDAKAAIVQTRGYRTPPPTVPSLADAPVGAKARIPDDAPHSGGLVLVRAASNEGWGDWHAVTDQSTGNWWSLGELEDLGAVVTHLPAPIPPGGAS